MGILFASSPEKTHATVPGRVASLDGWRGIAILLVLMDHLQYSILGYYWKPWMQTGQHGVTIFFVLSGFLITSKLTERPIRLRNFYIRRIFRLWPVAWAYLSALILLGLISRTSLISNEEVRSCLLFYRNFAGHAGLGFAGHFWSLSLEEQFYLVWPCLLLLAGPSRCRWIAALGACACAFYRQMFWMHYDKNLFNNQTQVRIDAILVGCLIALIVDNPANRAVTARCSRYMVVPAGIVLVYSIVAFQWLPPLFENVAIVILITFTVLNPSAMLTRILSFRALAYLGTISYSIYVWQEIFMVPGRSKQHLAALFIVMPAIILGSYYFMERPFTKIGHALTKT